MRKHKPVARRGWAGRGLLAALCLVGFALDAEAALTVSKSIAPSYPSTINPGDITAFRITLSNDNTAAAITGVAFTDDLAANNGTTGDAVISIAGNGLISSTCGGTLTTTIGTSNISLSGGTIPAASGGTLGSCEIIVEVTSTVGGSAPNNVIPSGAVTGNDGSPQSNTSPAAQSFAVNTLQAPTISKAFAASSVVEGELVRLTLVINNPNSTADLPLTSVTDDLSPLGLLVAPVPNASAVCTGTGASNPTLSSAAGASSVVFSGGVVGRSGACTLAVDLRASPGAAGVSGSVTRTNVLPASAIVNTRGLTPAADASADITVQSPLRVAKAFSPSSIAAGQAATLTITLFNDASTNTLGGLGFTDDPIGTPAGLTLNGAPSTTCSGGTATAVGSTGVSLSGGSLGPGSSCTVTVPFTATLAAAGTPQTHTNDIPAGAVSNSDSVVSRAATASVTVLDQLAVSKAIDNATPAAGATVRYTVTVNNFTAGPLSGVSFTDTLPSNLTVLSTPAPSISAGCNNFSNDFSNTSAPAFTFDMPAGVGASPGSCAIAFSALVSATAAPGSVLTNNLPANSVKTAGTCGAGAICNADASNNATATVAVPTPVTKAFVPSTLSEGSPSRLTITLSNNTANVLSGVDLLDNLPSLSSPTRQVVVADPANVTSTCGGAATITATPGSNSVRIQNGSIPARAGGGTGAAGSCTLALDVSGPAGAFTNTIPANALSATGLDPSNTNAAASANVTFTPALAASKSFTPGSIQPGGVSRLSVRLENIGTGNLRGVAFTDPLPADMRIANPANALTTCAGSGGSPVITATAGASSWGVSSVLLPPGGVCEVLVDVTASGSTASVNSIPIGNITASGGVFNTTAVNATLNRDAGAITVTKNITPNTISAPGQVARLTVTLNNTGALNLSNLAVSDFFTTDGTSGATLNGMRIAASPNLSTNCPGGLLSGVANGSSFSLSGASLAPSASCSFAVDVTTLAVGTIQNTIPVGAISTTQGVSNTLPAVSSLANLGRIGVQKSFTPATIKPGERSRLRLRFLNPFAVPLTNIAVTDNLPAGLSVPAGANPVITCAGGTITAPLSSQVRVSGASLAAASSGGVTTCDAEIDVMAASGGDAAYTNSISAGEVTAMAGATPVQNDPPDVSATLQARNAVSLAKAFSPTTVVPGANSRLTITLNNPNSIPLTEASLTDNLPNGLTVALVPNPVTTCTGTAVSVVAVASATNFRLTGATIPAGASCTVAVDVVSNVPGTYTNTLATQAFNSAEGVRNEEPASSVLTVSFPPTLAKAFSPASINSGGTSTLTLELGNPNASALTLTAPLTDTLPTSPGPMTVANPNGLSTTCPGAVTASPGSGAISYANGASIPAGGCRISVNVTASSNGSHVNNIPAGGLTTNAGGNADAASASLVVSPLGFISGKVFRDNDVTPDGNFTAGVDQGLAGITINLTGTDFGGDGVLGGGDDVAVSVSVTTDALGNYSFTGLNAGSYTVTEPAQPSGTLNGITSAGTVSGGGGGTPGNATAVGVSPSSISNIVLQRDGGGLVAGSPNNNFAEVVPSSIAGRVFLDQNNNGVQNGADTALAGVVIELLDGGGTVIATTTTDSNGDYAFTGLLPGTYSVREPTQPPNSANGLTIPGSVPNGGTAGTASAATVTPSRISSIVLPPNTASTGNNFAELPSGRTISGRMFLDFDNNGLQNGADHGLVGETLNLTGVDASGNAVSRTTTTDSSGQYAFTGLPEGTYTITQASQPSGTNNGITTAGSTGGSASLPSVAVSSISNVDLTGANTVSAGNDFAETLGSATDLTIDKTADLSSRIRTYTLTVSNIGNVASSGLLTVIDTLPSGVTGVSAPVVSPWNCSLSADRTQLTCTTNAAVPAGGSLPAITLEVSITAGMAGQVLLNTASVAGGGEPNALTGNNTDTASGAVIDPSGVVYDAVTRLPVPGATVTLLGPPGFDPALHLSGGSNNLTQVTGNNGAYQYLLLPGAPSGTYTLSVTPPAAYQPFPSSLIPPEPGALTVGPTPNPRAIQTQPTAPAIGSPTTYFLSFVIGPGSADVINNHIPLDPILAGAVTLSKSTPLVNVSRGDLVPYTITARNTLASTLSNVTIRDSLPAGFAYRRASGSVNGQSLEPEVAGRELTWVNQSLGPNETRSYQLIAIVGVGVSEGEYVNRAVASNAITGTALSNPATATVRVVPDPTFDCADLIGKVFDDLNINGYQDPEEPGIPRVRLATVNGLLITSDAEGRFHIPCAAVPNADRGGNFVLKLDIRTLPTGYRLTTENPRDVRLTRGKLSKLNFGAALHRVVRIEVTAAAFEADGKNLRPEWSRQIDRLLQQIKTQPSVIRLAEPKSLPHPAPTWRPAERLASILRERWEQLDCCYPLAVELEP